MNRKNIHVVPRADGNWGVRVAGNSRVSSVHGTQADAIGIARGRARTVKCELLIHGRNGRIREKDSYGNDPHPPKG